MKLQYLCAFVLFFVQLYTGQEQERFNPRSFSLQAMYERQQRIRRALEVASEIAKNDPHFQMRLWGRSRSNSVPGCYYLEGGYGNVNSSSDDLEDMRKIVQDWRGRLWVDEQSKRARRRKNQ